MAKWCSVKKLISLMAFVCFCCIPAFIQTHVMTYSDSFDGLKRSEQVLRRLNHRNARRNRNIASFYDETSTSDYSDIVSDLHRDKILQPHDRLSSGTSVQLNSAELPVTLGDVYISVKTSRKFHKTRLQLVIDTWFQTAKDQTFFYTDDYDEKYDKSTGGHLINTSCKDTHTRKDLSCKMGAEYDGYLKSNKKWWCHFDDDNYVNVNELVTLLRRHKWSDDVYLGKPSLGHPFYVTHQEKRLEFWFATGGAGVCISRTLAHKMAPWCSGGELARTSDSLRIPDDCTLGYVVFNRLGVNLTKSDLLHSHLERLADLNHTDILKQVSLSYRLNGGGKKDNVLDIPNRTKLRSKDPTKFLSLHCHFYPSTSYCRAG